MKSHDKRKKPTNKIPPAGMRNDKERPTTGSPEPDRDSLLDEIEWRKEHRQ